MKKSKKQFQSEVKEGDNKVRQVLRRMKRVGGKVKHVTRSGEEQIFKIRDMFKPKEVYAHFSPQSKVVRMTVFTNDNTIRVSEFPLLDHYYDDEDGLILILNPNEPAKQRTFVEE